MYELDFHRVGNGDCSGDAISFRYFDGSRWKVVVIDGGYEQTGQDLVAHIRAHYQTNRVDYVVSTHPDGDHMSGLRVLMQEMEVGELWMHVPEVHSAQILPLFRSRRWQVQNLQRELARQYPYVGELMDFAAEKGTPVYEPFAGSRIGPMTVLSPTREMYEGLLPQFRNTPPPDQDLLQQLGHWLEGIGRRVARDESKTIREDWATETLRDGGITSAENESSVVMLAELPGPKTVLFTGDAGLKALYQAAIYAAGLNMPIERPGIFQVPHHGSRNNIAPRFLDYIVGPKLPAGQTSPVISVISAGKDDDHHPRQVVVNALHRRGSTPYTTKTGTLYFRGAGVQGRGWGDATAFGFSQLVEGYDE